jgi:Fe-S-cluster containining protein
MASSRSTKRNEEIEGAELLKFRCGRCGNCCRLRIPVTDADVRRLMEGTGKPAEKIVHFFKKSEFGESPGPIAWIKLGPRQRDRKAMCIREVYDRCLYLRPKKGCVAYEHRPVVCREHPFDITLDDDDRKIVEVKIGDICECAGTFDGKVGKAYIKKIYRQSLSQDEEYHAKVRRWNRRKKIGTEREFLEFIGLR